MYLVILEPARKHSGEHRYLSDRVFFNFDEAYRYAQKRMLNEPVEAAIAQIQMPYLTKVTHPGKKEER